MNRCKAKLSDPIQSPFAPIFLCQMRIENEKFKDRSCRVV